MDIVQLMVYSSIVVLVNINFCLCTYIDSFLINAIINVWQPCHIYSLT